jgi:hypothetical protein
MTCQVLEFRVNDATTVPCSTPPVTFDVVCEGIDSATGPDCDEKNMPLSC